MATEVQYGVHLASRTGIRSVSALLGIAALLAAVYLRLSDPGHDLQRQALVLTTASIGAGCVAWRKDRGAGGAAFLYVVVFSLFHCGLVIAVAWGGQSLIIGEGDNSWVLSPAVAAGADAVLLAQVSISLGIVAGKALSLKTMVLRITESDRTFARPGLVALAFGFVLLLVSLADYGGLGALFGGYLSFLEAVGGTGTFGFAVLLMSLGVCFLVAQGGRARVIGLISFTIIALVGLPLGLRGSVLFLGAVVLVIEAKRRRIPGVVFAAGAAAVLGLIATIRVTRVGGVEALLSGLPGFSPLEAIAEMGYSLYPVIVVQGWLDSGVPLRRGETFVAPLLRLFESASGAKSPDPDTRLFNVEVQALVGPIGGSPVAEALRNFGTPGIMVVMLLIGLALAVVDVLPPTPMGGAVSAVIMVPLMIAVRNSFAPFLIQIAIGIMLVLLAGRRASPKTERAH